MRYFSIVFLLLLITSCVSPAKMFSSGLSKINKAIEKDPSLKLPADTITDTLIVEKIDTFNNEIIKTVTKTITNNINDCKYDEIKLKSAKEVRAMKRMFKDSLTHVIKMYKLETKRLEDSLVQMNKYHKTELKVIRSNNSKEKVADRQKTKQERGGWFERTFGRYWWILPLITLILGLVGGWYFRNLIPSIPNMFKRN